METIIQLGHYQEKTSLGSDTPVIIRIIGEDPKREGFWLTQDKKSIPEYALAEEYVFLYTSSESKEKSTLPVNIFAGIGEPSEIPIKIQSEIISEQPGIIDISQQTTKIKVEEIKIPFDISVLNKISIDYLNQISQEKFGINKHTKPIINIELPIEFNYDINKLIQTIQLLDLNENIIVDFLVNQISLEIIKPLIKQKLKKLLLSEEIKPQIQNESKIIQEEIKPFSSIVPSASIEKIQELHEENQQIIKTEINPILEAGISEIDNYIKINFTQ